MGEVINMGKNSYTEIMYSEWKGLLDFMIKSRESNNNDMSIALRLATELVGIADWKRSSNINKEAIKQMVLRYRNEYPEKAEIIKDYLELQLIDRSPRRH
ncbi:hypothetical protein [Priestia megaterium]|uniref:hypothetical protein n=1 Tax=Priestia megaterium TaxID=1404 RepID=UPI000BFE39D2|nr:hypothetical protein [Priestia megaterium]PGO60645.1 hypothetical protein CN981_08840 [Priestia megaterium]